MDTFFEQIIKVKRTGKDIAILVATLLGAAVLLSIAGMFLMTSYMPLAFLGGFGVCWGAYKLIMLTYVEYEYIYTNGDLDIDKITARASRKRVVSIVCSSVERYGKYNPAVRPSDSVKKVFMLCDADDPDAKYLIAPSKKDGLVMIVFAPDERMRGVIEKAIPRIAQ
ncbi:MAG: hypothetical protein J6V50_03360 [Clostridia bacterium]|nr:hypothetical protein [Clostridia bacterium]